MYFVISCIDKADHDEVRRRNRPAHLEFLQSWRDSVKLAGPYVTEDNSAMTGSLIVVEADTLGAAKAFAAADPYARAGLFTSVDIRPWIWSVGDPERE
jgi:hypothetical protein